MSQQLMHLLLKLDPLLLSSSLYLMCVLCIKSLKWLKIMPMALVTVCYGTASAQALTQMEVALRVIKDLAFSFVARGQVPMFD